VCNTPDYSEVADHAIPLMLALTGGIVCFHEHLVRDPVVGFDSALALLVRLLRGGAFGEVGFGRIGTASAFRAKAFSFRVVGFDPYVSAATEIRSAWSAWVRSKRSSTSPMSSTFFVH
jgi:lactate dehydrogenase-like 2-hydroxyacid dehydrogenase